MWPLASISHVSIRARDYATGREARHIKRLPLRFRAAKGHVFQVRATVERLIANAGYAANDTQFTTP